jgi:hypothetical protein
MFLGALIPGSLLTYATGALLLLLGMELFVAAMTSMATGLGAVLLLLCLSAAHGHAALRDFQSGPF